MIRLKNMPHMLWIAGLALIAACSDGGGEERPGPQQTALSIVWTPEAPAAGQSVRFSLGGDVSNVRSVLWMFGDGKTSSAAAGGEVDHAYAAAGDYTVKAAVTPVAGSMSELSTAANAGRPLRLRRRSRTAMPRRAVTRFGRRSPMPTAVPKR